VRVDQLGVRRAELYLVLVEQIDVLGLAQPFDQRGFDRDRLGEGAVAPLRGDEQVL
jgi:hypothetical protein